MKRIVKSLVVGMALLIGLAGCRYDRVSALSEYEQAVRTLEIGPFDFKDADVVNVLNELFVAANSELSKNGYDRSIGMVAGWGCENGRVDPLTFRVPRQTIYNTMSSVGRKIGANVKFENGCFRLSAAAGDSLDEAR